MTPEWDASPRQLGMRGDRSMIYEQPFVQGLQTVESLVDQLFPQAIQRNMDWRAKKLKDFIDNAPGKVLGNLGDVCNELDLPLSVRQARRLFKESTAASFNEYTTNTRPFSPPTTSHTPNSPR